MTRTMTRKSPARVHASADAPLATAAPSAASSARSPAPSLDFRHLQARTVLLPDPSITHFVLIGCGGTGSWLAPHLVRLARAMLAAGRSVRLTFVDPDVVEHKNVVRQNFCDAEVGQQKAVALAVRYGTAWGLDIAACVSCYDQKLIYGDGLHEGGMLREKATVILIGCVDNAGARRAIEETFAPIYEGGRPWCWWLDCGNHARSGQVIVGSSMVNGQVQRAFSLPTHCTALPLPTILEPGLRSAQDAVVEPGDDPFVCTDQLTTNTQSLMVNQMTAAIAADMLMQLVTGQLTRCAAWFDLKYGCTVTNTYILPEEIARVCKRPVRWFTTMQDVISKVVRRPGQPSARPNQPRRRGTASPAQRASDA